MNSGRVSVVVASRERPGDLSRCLTALGQQYYRPFEIVVAADAEGLAAAKAHPLGPYLKTVIVEEASISAARNAGIALAAGEIVAFIDDDACAAPTWLNHLCGVFSDTGVAAATGTVLGRNGISVQWGPRIIRGDAHHEDARIGSPEPTIFDPMPGAAFKTEGTNCAFRRNLLVALGGFDPAYRFYLDEADLNMRMAAEGARTAFVPLAVVQHGFARSRFRRQDRVPTDLTEIGASLAIFLERYCPTDEQDRALARHRDEQRRRLLRHMIDGRIEPGDVGPLMVTFERGLEVGRTRPRTGLRLRLAAEPFRDIAVHVKQVGHVAYYGRRSGRAQLLQQARDARAQGAVVSLFCFSRTALYHSVRMTDDGIWLQSGGVYGRSLRTQPLHRRIGLRERFEEEMARVAAMREFP